VTGNAANVRHFANTGRGEFHQALAWILQQDSDPVVFIIGDHDFRVRKYVEFYARYHEDSRQVIYYQGNDPPPGGAAWLMVHRPDEHSPPGLVEHDAKGNAYRLARAYPSRGPGCWGWFVYRRW
jgi:hypothetical protein